MLIVSASASASKSAVARSFLAETASPSCLESTSGMYDSPRLTASTLRVSISTLTVLRPAARQLERERQADVSQANHTCGRTLGLDAVDECVDEVADVGVDMMFAARPDTVV